VHLDKARGVYGDQAQPFEAQLTIINDVMAWTMRDLENVEVQRAADLKDEGFSVRDIAAELGISKSRVDRLLKKTGDAEARHKMNGNPSWVGA
jgi:putative DNA primase/helicase